MNKQLVISFKTILYTLLLVIGVLLVWKLLPVFVLLLISLFIVIAMENPIQFFMRQHIMNKKLSRSASVAVAYSILAGLLVVILTGVFPPLVIQARKLILKLPEFVASVGWLQNIDTSEIISSLSSVTENVSTLFSSALAVFVFLVGVVFVLTLSVFISLDWVRIKENFISLIIKKRQTEARETIQDIEESIWHWAKGQVILMLIVGGATYIGLRLIDVEFAPSIALIAGLFEFIPWLGPLISGAFAVLVVSTQAPDKIFLVIGLFVLIQQLENNLLVPKVMQRVSGFSPAVILIALTVGNELLGPVGAVLAVPVMMVSVILIKRFLRFNS